MKSLKSVILLYVLFMKASVFAQDTVFVSHDKTTAIEFPVRIKMPLSMDGFTVTMANDHTLALRATRMKFAKTSLEVTNLDGVVHHFPVAYSYGRAGKLITIPADNQMTSPVKLNTVESITQSIAGDKKFNQIAHDKNSKIQSALGSIAISGDTFFYKIKLINNSNISYDIDFIRFYVRDLQRAKRTVTQEQEIHPVYTYGLETPSIGGKESGTFVFAINKFPITGDKALFVEVYEKNGGRHLYLKVKPKEIEKAKAFKVNH